MRWIPVALAIAAASCGGSTGRGRTGAGSTLPASVVDPYLKIHDELAVDRLDTVKQNAGEIATAASALGATATKIDTAALQLASAGDLAQARDRYGVLSDAVVAYMKDSNVAAPEGVRTAFCPMARRPWLQRGGTLANPYYGTSMPTCGEFR